VTTPKKTQNDWLYTYIHQAKTSQQNAAHKIRLVTDGSRRATSDWQKIMQFDLWHRKVTINEAYYRITWWCYNSFCLLYTSVSQASSSFCSIGLCTDAHAAL